MSRCLGKKFKAGDEIVLSRMDHDANVAPWLLLAQDLGLVVKWLDFDTGTYEFPDDALSKLLTSKTKLLAMGMASNCTGTVHDVARFTREAKAAGALVYLGWGAIGPALCHRRAGLGCGCRCVICLQVVRPTSGRALGPQRPCSKKPSPTRCAPCRIADIGHKFETGTQSHEGMAGCNGGHRISRTIWHWRHARCQDQISLGQACCLRASSSRCISSRACSSSKASPFAVSPPTMPCTAVCPLFPSRSMASYPMQVGQASCGR